MLPYLSKTKMDGLDVYRQEGADKRWQPEETQPIHGDHMGERSLGRHEIVKKT